MPQTVWPGGCAQSHWGRPLLTHTCTETQTQVRLSLCGISGSWCAQGFVWTLWASLAGMGFVSKHNFTLPTILMELLLCPWMWGIFLWWDPTFSCQWLFSSELLFWSSRRSWVHTSFYPTILPAENLSFPFYCFPLFLCIDHQERLSYLSLLFFGTRHSKWYIVLFLLCLSLLFFSQLFVRPPQTAILPFCISFSWSLPPVRCHEPPSIVL